MKRKNKLPIETPAKGVHACLLNVGDTFILRVYKHSTEERRKYFKEIREKGITRRIDDPMFAYKDYDIHHYDLNIIIDEDHASFYDDGTIDYDSKTLGGH